ncbi:MAG TPA: hypothetical protein VIR63_02800 [Pontiella sp.]
MALAFLAGCATTFQPWSLSKVEEGMERDQVVQLLGIPESSFVTNGIERLLYTYREDPISADDPLLDASTQFKTAAKRFDETLKEYRYVVILNNGKVSGYKELLD